MTGEGGGRRLSCVVVLCSLFEFVKYSQIYPHYRTNLHLLEFTGFGPLHKVSPVHPNYH